MVLFFVIMEHNYKIIKGSDKMATNELQRLVRGEPYWDTKINANMDILSDGVEKIDSKFFDNAGAHNSIYRGKYLGGTVTDEQYQAISSGLFTDLYIGDYWTISGINWRIAGFDYYYNVGDTPCTVHHAVIVPDTVLYTHAMNDTNTTTGGYTNSKMRTSGLDQAIATIKGIFGTHVIKHREMLVNATTDGKSSGWSWIDSEVELLSEIMVYGSVAFGESTIGNGYNVASSDGQLPLFALRPDMKHIRVWWWLRDACSASNFAGVSGSGTAGNNGATVAGGVRPRFLIS